MHPLLPTIACCKGCHSCRNATFHIGWPDCHGLWHVAPLHVVLSRTLPATPQPMCMTKMLSPRLSVSFVFPSFTCSAAPRWTRRSEMLSMSHSSSAGASDHFAFLVKLVRCWWGGSIILSTPTATPNVRRFTRTAGSMISATKRGQECALLYIALIVCTLLGQMGDSVHRHC